MVRVEWNSTYTISVKLPCSIPRQVKHSNISKWLAIRTRVMCLYQVISMPGRKWDINLSRLISSNLGTRAPKSYYEYDALCVHPIYCLAADKTKQMNRNEHAVRAISSLNLAFCRKAKPEPFTLEFSTSLYNENHFVISVRTIECAVCKNCAQQWRVQ